MTAAFVGALLHPLLVPAHLMAVVALGVLIGQQRWSISVPAVYGAAVLAGLGAIALAYVPTAVDGSLLVAVAIAGLLIALARPMPWLIGATLAGGLGLSLALDSPPEAISLREANLTLLGTAAGAIAAPLALAQASSRLHRGWQRIGARILGSWIAASAVLVLALRWVR